MSGIGSVSALSSPIRGAEIRACNLRDTCEVVTTVVAPILLIVAFALSLHYGIHPTGKLVHFSSSFSMCVPGLVMSSLGVVALIALVVQCSRYKKVSPSFSRTMAMPFRKENGSLAALTRKALHPRGRSKDKTAKMWMAEWGCHVTPLAEARASYQPSIVEFQTRDAITLRAIWRGKPNPQQYPTVILYHGNGCWAHSINHYSLGDFYFQRGFNVLIPEYRGYGMSEGRAAQKTQEVDILLDAEAAVTFLTNSLELDRGRIIAHGHSLGGCYASAAAQHGIGGVILHAAFSSAPEVYSNVSRLLSVTSTANVVDGIYNTQACREKAQKYRLEDQIDGLNNAKKIHACRATTPAFVIRMESDHIMAPAFGERLIASAYPDDDALRRERLVTLPGGHNTLSFNQETLDHYLHSLNLLTES